jgi:thiamine biosynthesis protein ThiS
MELTINGESRDFPDGLTVASLVEHLGMKPDRLAVELNLEIVPRTNWQATALNNGDKLEIVHFVGGGLGDNTAETAQVEEADVPEAPQAGAWICPNCAASPNGKFCPACGEKQSSSGDLSVGHLVSHALEVLFHADSKLWRSFRLLFAKPGFLSAEYVRGRRKPYVHPFQMFFVANVAYFLLQPFTGWTGLRTTLFVHMHMMSYNEWASRLVEHRIAVKGISLTEFTRAFDHILDIQARSLVLLMVPVFALALWVLEWRKHRFFGEHLVFALHFYAFWVIAVFLITYGLSTPVVYLLASRGVHFNEESLNTFLLWIARVGVAVYLFLALRTFYRDKALPAGVKAIVLAWATSYIDSLYRFILFLAALYSA